ncbi:MAG: hypothetical protein ABW105_00630 [Candidatus Thiodiazotropha sp. 6PLUC1]
MAASFKLEWRDLKLEPGNSMLRATLQSLIICLLLAGCGLSPEPSNVKISKQPAEGLTQSSFDEGYLQQLTDEYQKGAEQSLQQTYDRNNIPQHERFSHAQAKGHYEWIGERQLAVIDLIYSNNPMRVMRVVGIEGDQLVTISCISPQGAQLDINSETGDCAEAISKHFQL